MRNFSLTLLSIFWISIFCEAQAPDSVNYQAVVRDADGKIVANQSVGVQIMILQGSINGTSVYSETHAPTTNKFGLTNLQIGGGISGDDFSAIDWSMGPYFAKVGVDPTGGTDYSLVMGTSQLLSVPYALHAKTAETILGGSGSDCGLSIGDTHAGGIIFYIEPCGCHGLVAKAEDEGLFQWATDNTEIYSTKTGLFGGGPNTKNIIYRLGAGNAPAAEICAGLSDGGFTDWYLPSEDELQMMFANLYTQGLGGLSNKYWSSTSTSDGFNALEVVFNDGGDIGRAGSNGRSFEELVRAVRAF